MRQRAKLSVSACLVVSVAMASVGVVRPAAAQESATIAAEALFDEGRRLMGEGKIAQACAKFAESQRIDPAPTTLLNLANCYEKNGQTASAWVTFRQATSAAKLAKRPDLAATGQKRANALEPKLSKLTLMAKTASEGQVIKRDGVVIGDAEWGSAIPVDPGPHTIEVTAPKHQPWKTTVHVAPNGAKATVDIPALPPEPEAARTTGTPLSPPVLVPIRGGAGGTGDEGEPARRSPLKTVGLVAMGAGVVGLGVGTFFVLKGKSKYDDSLKECPRDKNLCSPAGVSLRDDARSAGTVASVAIGIGAAALVGGAVLWLTAPSGKRAAEPPKRAAYVQVTPTIGGVSVSGAW